MDLSVSAIMSAAESAQNYKYRYVLGIKEEPGLAQQEGTMVHSFLLEPDKFYEQYYTDPEPPVGFLFLKTVEDLKEYLRSNNEKTSGKKEELAVRAKTLIYKFKANLLVYDDWIQSQFAGKKYITKLKWQRLHFMRDEIMQNKFVGKYLGIGKKEVQLEAEILGHTIRGRVDWLVDIEQLPYIICIDLKKSKSADLLKFRRTIEDNQLHVQAALYSELCKKIYNKDCLFAWQVIETGIPFYNAAFACNEALLEAGLVDAKLAIKRIEHGMKTNQWPGKNDGNVQQMDLSSYFFDRIAERESILEEMGV